MILPMENTEKMIFSGVGKYGIPEIKPETDIRIDKLEWLFKGKSKLILEQLEENTEIYKTQVVLFLLKWRKNFLRTIKCRLYPNQKWMK